ncbi:unnamed protein product [Calicophoron daubneyi]|uniref:Uncharacterized protein n=1 Tax=Calicophoron daubneyi TaxID=300641 RepID=A0AAV2TPM9_CALDB
MAGLIGTWRCVSTENTEALLNEYGVEREKMEELLGKKQKLIISMPDSTHIHIRTEGDPHAIECAFDEEFEMHDPAGKIHKCIMRKESDMCIFAEEPTEPMGIRMTFELHISVLHVTTVLGSVTSVSKFFHF